MASPYYEKSRDNLETQLSKKLSGVLRHGHDGFKRHIDPNGWLEISTFLRNSHFCKDHRITYDQIVSAVTSNDKQRYKISEDGLKIKANQGHTLHIQDETLKTITYEQAATYSAVVHGTYYKVLNRISKFGLSRMRRNHIHLTASDRVDASIGVISGFRGSCEILVYIDICAAIKDGIDFFVSENNVILCSGNDQGFLEAKYFLKIIDRITNKDVDVSSKISGLNASEVETDKSDKPPSDDEIKRRNIQKQIGKLRKKIKEIDELESNLESGKIEKGNLEKTQIEKLARRAVYDSEIEKHLAELRAMNPVNVDGNTIEDQEDIPKLFDQNQSEANKSEMVQSEATQSESIQSEANKSEMVQSEAIQSESIQSETMLSETVQSKNEEKIISIKKEIRKLEKKLKNVVKICSDLESGKIKEDDLEVEQKEKISRRKALEEAIVQYNNDIEVLSANK